MVELLNRFNFSTIQQFNEYEMKRYEGLFILNTQAKEEGIKDALDKISAEISSAGGKVETVQKMDRKNFARIADKKHIVSHRLWRKMTIDGIRQDPDWKNGDYTTEPRAGLQIAAENSVQLEHRLRSQLSSSALISLG